LRGILPPIGKVPQAHAQVNEAQWGGYGVKLYGDMISKLESRLYDVEVVTSIFALLQMLQ
jgi:hypothetical protein